MILITGAAGKTGRALIKALHSPGIKLNDEPIRVLVRKPEQIQVMLELGVQEVISGDLRSPEILTKALSGIRAVYHIPPNIHPDEFLIAKQLIDLVRIERVERFVYHSVLHPQIEAMPHHWQKMRVEELIFSAGIDFTILQPEAYMQNILGQWDSILKQKVFSVPYGIETKLGQVDLEDVALAAAVVLTGQNHRFAIYELAGPDILDQVEAARILSVVLGYEVKAQSQPRDEWSRQAKASGLGSYQISTLIKMFEYYERFGFYGNPGALFRLIGKEPENFTGFVERIVRSSQKLVDADAQ